MSLPLVSIGLPVFNGEKYLRDALDSILAQTYSNFELIISDNASTDKTNEVCATYAAKDSRIQYSRNDYNQGVGRNHNKVFQASHGDYFMWSAYDDLYAPDFIVKCVDVLDKNPSVVLCHSLIVHIDKEGKQINLINIKKGRSSKAHERFRGLILLDHTCEQIYGLIRSDVLQKTKLHLNYTDSDRTLLSEISLHGQFYEVQEPLFFHRIHPGSSTTIYSDWRDRMLFFEPNLKSRIVFPHWLQFAHYFKSISGSPLNRFEKARCYLHMGGWLIKYGRGLAKDVLIALLTKLSSVFKMQHRNNMNGEVHETSG